MLLFVRLAINTIEFEEKERKYIMIQTATATVHCVRANESQKYQLTVCNTNHTIKTESVEIENSSYRRIVTRDATKKERECAIRSCSACSKRRRELIMYLMIEKHVATLRESLKLTS